MTKFELNILGCGSATCTLRHNPSCQVLNVRDNLLMIDCGEGAQLEMRRYGLKFSRLGHIFLSHLHGDHCFGLPGLVATMGLLHRTSSLTIHTFEEGAEMFSQMLKFFCQELPYEVRFNVIAPRSAVIYEDDAIVVRTFPLLHRVQAVGYRIDEKPKLRHIRPDAVAELGIPQHALRGLRQGKDYVLPDGTFIANERLTTPADPSRSYAYCSDTRFSKRAIKAVSGVNWLYHEATYDDANELKAYKRHHSTARQAAIAAREAGAGNLIIGHFSKRFVDETPLLQQAQEEFPRVLLANEGLKIDLNEDIKQ